MCNAQEESFPQQVNRLTGELHCVKCGRDVPLVVQRVRDAFCRDCFLTYAVHKFRSAIGKSKAILPKEHVLVAFSAGSASCALLHFLQEGIKEGKLRFSVTVLHVDELGLLGLAEKERCERVKGVLNLLSRSSFPLLFTPLEQVLNIPAVQDAASAGGGEGERASLSQAVTADMDLGSQFNPGDAGRLRGLLEALPDACAKQEMVRVLRTQLLVAVARQRGFDKVVVGDTASLLALNVMTLMAQGKGAQVAFQTGISDKRYGDVMIVRPLRDLKYEEVETYNRLHDIQSLTLPSIADQGPPGSSLQGLTASFIQGLQADFPSTVPNIVRTGSKLSEGDSSLCQARCSLCQSALDTFVGEASALRAVEVSEQLQRAKRDALLATRSMPQPDTQDQAAALDALRSSLCYGCRLTTKGLKDVSVLPPYAIKESQTPVLSCQEMPPPHSNLPIEKDKKTDT